jgi:crotonobetainyl-CoA:carnitine CoA-transferase CaiB-like acyl-CoA transferase
MVGPLQGIRALECGIFMNGPQATKVLAELGAEVVKVEPPRTGDPGRALAWPGDRPGYSVYWEAQNRGKRDIVLDLKQPVGLEVLLRLVERADVFLQNFRFGVAERLGIAYPALARLNPRLIYASAYGFGSKGPEGARPVLDYLGQARSGFMSRVGEPGRPPRILGAFAPADQVGAYFLAMGVITALYHRERTGEGQEVEVSQLGAMLALQTLGIERALSAGEPPPPETRADARNPLLLPYQTRDGRWIMLGGLQADRHWPGLCRALAVPELENDPRFATTAGRAENARALIAALEAAFRRFAAADALARLAAEDVLCSPVNEYADLPADPQVVANGYITTTDHPVVGRRQVVSSPFRFSKTEVAVGGLAPEFGQHTEEVLLEAGYTWAEIAALRERGAFG